MCVHTSAHTHIYTHSPIQAHSFIDTLTHTHSFIDTHSLIHTHSYVHIDTLMQTCSLIHTDTYTHVYTHSHTNTFTHIHKYLHTYTLMQTLRHAHTHAHSYTHTHKAYLKLMSYFLRNITLNTSHKLESHLKFTFFSYLVLKWVSLEMKLYHPSKKWKDKNKANTVNEVFLMCFHNLIYSSFLCTIFYN